MPVVVVSVELPVAPVIVPVVALVVPGRLPLRAVDERVVVVAAVPVGFVAVLAPVPTIDAVWPGRVELVVLPLAPTEVDVVVDGVPGSAPGTLGVVPGKEVPGGTWVAPGGAVVPIVLPAAVPAPTPVPVAVAPPAAVVALVPAAVGAVAWAKAQAGASAASKTRLRIMTLSWLSASNAWDPREMRLI